MTGITKSITAVEVPVGLADNLNLLRTEEPGSMQAKQAVVEGKKEVEVFQYGIAALLKNPQATHQNILDAERKNSILISECGQTRNITLQKHVAQAKSESETAFPRFVPKRISALVVNLFPRAPTHETLNRDIDADKMHRALQVQNKDILKMLRQFSDSKAALGSAQVKPKAFSDESISKSADVQQNDVQALFAAVKEVKIGENTVRSDSLWQSLTDIGANPAHILKYATETSRTLLAQKLTDHMASKKVGFVAQMPTQIHSVSFVKERDQYKVTLLAQLPVAVAADGESFANVDAVMTATLKAGEANARISCSFNNVVPNTSVTRDIDRNLERAFVQKSVFGKIASIIS
jgi:hypothetical protein